MDLALIIPAFIAGLFTFLAPCTLPLVPGYLAFIGGTSGEDMNDPEVVKKIRRRVIFNGLFFVIGFTVVFVGFGIIFSLGGIALAQYRIWLSRIGGAIVILFGLYMMQIFQIKWLNFLNQEKRFHVGRALKPGKPSSAFIFGSTFAFGWTPCIGPVLGTILLLASSYTTALQGGILLLVFSIGLGIPFMLIALGYGHAANIVKRFTKYMNVFNKLGGAFLIFLGVLILTDNMGVWFAFAYNALSFINYDGLLDLL